MNLEFIKGQKFLWKIKASDPFLVRKISDRFSLSSPISQTLVNRGLQDLAQIESYLFTSVKEVFSPEILKGAFIAVQRILKAIDNKEKILIFGDYDVDGITSTSLLLVSLLPLGANINFYLPNRKKDGYGLSEKFVQKAYDSGYKLIITVDNGITAIKPAALAKKLGIDLIITDHHLPGKKLPIAISIVDTNQPECAYPYKDLAGVGVIFKIISFIYNLKNLELPDKVYELLMLGTVADVAPLTGENRYWVRYGLNKINSNKSYSINVLAQNSGLNKSLLNSLDIGFSIAPQINALGRLDDARQAVKFLISSDLEQVESIGQILKNINEERKKLDQNIFNQIEYSIFNKRIDLEKENIIVAASDSWQAGVIGLVAGRLVQNYGKPALLFYLDNNTGILKGSCRSIHEYNIFQALQNNSDLLINFGGHSFAAGLKLYKENLPELKYRLEQDILTKVSSQDLLPKIELDAVLDLPELNNKLLKDLEYLEPFGNQNKQPNFLIKNLALQQKPVLLKDKHVKILVFADGILKPVIFFNRPELYSIFNNLQDKTFNLAANVNKNEWNDKISIELQGLDINLE